MLHVEFEPDPPFGVPRKKERTEFAEILRNKPDADALLARAEGRRNSTLYTTAWQIRRADRNMDMFGPAGTFEAMAISMFDETRLYVRYVGKKGIDVPADPDTP